MKTLIKIQEQGIDIQYRCPKCRECWSCKNAPESERLSIREELEEEAIKDAVKIDFVKKRITATMPLRGDPSQYLSDNREIAEKVLIAQCKKLQNDDEAKEVVVKAFKKLSDNNYAVKFSDLTPEQQTRELSCNHHLIDKK